MEYIISLCADCLTILPEGLGSKLEAGEAPCPNCGTDTLPREMRIEAAVSEEDYEKVSRTGVLIP